MPTFTNIISPQYKLSASYMDRLKPTNGGVTSDIVLNLKQCALFSDLDSDDFNSVTQNLIITNLNPGEVLFHQQQPARHLFLLGSGYLKLFRVSQDGKEKVMDLVSPGSTFAEAIMFLEGHRYPVSATAIEASQVICIDAQNYREILQNSTNACFKVMAQMSLRLHEQIAEIDRLTMHSASSRLANFLLERLGGQEAENPVIHLEATKRVIASKISISPETLSRILARFQIEGFIQINENQITLTNLNRLRDYAEDVF